MFCGQAGVCTVRYADTYGQLAGYRFASAGEYSALWDASVSLNGTPTSRHLHYNQGGWSGNTNNSGVANRQFFAFADIFNGVRETRDIVHAGNLEMHAALYQSLNYEASFYSGGGGLFGGFILIKDNVTVPEPSIIALFGLGLVVLGSVRRRKV